MVDIKRRTAIVTGGSRGIGRSIIECLIEDGYKIATFARNEKELNQLRISFNLRGNSLLAMKVDISDEQQVKNFMMKAIKYLGGIDVLINNAGVYGPAGYFETNSQKKWLEALSINLLGTVSCTRYVLPYMKKQKTGKIVNLTGGGIGGDRPYERFSAYYTSKYAIVGFTEVIAAEVSDWNIQVNCISPGAINTKMTQYLLKQKIENIGQDTYLRTVKQLKSGGDSVELVKEMVRFLVSHESDHLSGKIISAKRDSISVLKSVTKSERNLYVLRRTYKKDE